MKNLPNEQREAGLALKPQNVNTTKILGETIAAPWKKGRFLLLDIIAAAFAASDSITITIQGRIAGSYLTATSTTTLEPYIWEDILDKDSNSLAFTAEADGGDLENGHITGTLDLCRLSIIAQDGSSQYDAIRVTAINSNAANVVVGAVYSITDLYEVPGSITDGLLTKQSDLGGDVYTS